jgi:plasmid stabilization system protein ParE
MAGRAFARSMSAYVLTPLAKQDIFDISAFIAHNSEPAADRVELAIYDACAFLAEGPLRGYTRSDLTPRSLGFWSLARYANYIVV